MRLTYVVLAAGSSSRMNGDKLSLSLNGVSPLERIARLLAGRPVVLVSSRERVAQHESQVPATTVVVNETPQNGMTSSFRVAVPFLAGCDRVGIVLADKPLLSRTTLGRLEDEVAKSARDIIYPRSPAGEPGHPVYLSRHAVDAATSLEDGDTLRTLRDDASLTALAIACDDAGAYLDIDTEEDWVAAEQFVRREEESV